jgi:hypothetical protein
MKSVSSLRLGSIQLQESDCTSLLPSVGGLCAETDCSIDIKEWVAGRSVSGHSKTTVSDMCYYAMHVDCRMLRLPMDAVGYIAHVYPCAVIAVTICH